MAELALKTKMTPEEYLAFERASEEKHEYVDGEVYAMSRCKRAHALITVNIASVLSTALREEDKPCEVYSSDMCVSIPSQRRYVYPDASVACGRPLFEDETEDNLLNPVVIFEVLSDSTENYDRGKKFDGYKSIPTFEEYVLVSQKRVQVERFRKQPDGTWERTELGAGDTLALDSIGCEMKVDAFYWRVFGVETGIG
jgi:Uma2 family endonuclease